MNIGWVCVLGVAGALADSAAADSIRLATGEVLEVQIVEITDGTIRFIHPVLGEVTVKRANVTILGVDQEVPVVKPAPVQPNQGAAAAPTQAPPPAAPPPAPPPPPEWKFKLVLAAGAASGNTENGNISTIFAAVRETPRVKTSFDTGYFFAESNGDRSENRFTIGGRQDWLNPDSRWFYFADARFDNDEFQSWDSRINGHVGLGYRLIHPPKLTLNLLGGIGLVKEFGSDNEDVRPEGLLGVEGKYDFAEKNAIVFNSTYFPDLTDIGEYRWTNNIGWSYLVDTKQKLSLTAGLQHEYQSNVDPGRKHNDFRFLAGLQLDF